MTVSLEELLRERLTRCPPNNLEHFQAALCAVYNTILQALDDEVFPLEVVFSLPVLLKPRERTRADCFQYVGKLSTWLESLQPEFRGRLKAAIVFP